MTSEITIELLAGESIDVDCACTDELGAALDVSGAEITFEVVALHPHTLSPSGAILFQRRNIAAGGEAGEIVQPLPDGGTDTFRVKVIPSNTPTRGRFRYRTRVEWPDSSPPIARIWEGEFVIW